MCSRMKDPTVLNKIISILISHKTLAFFYGIFLFLYQLSFVEQWISSIHPILIIWAFAIVAYDIFYRRIWKTIPFWKPLVLFMLSAGVTAVITREAGIVNNIKIWLLVILPILAFYPVCLLESRNKNIHAFLISMHGAAGVMCVSSAISLWMYVNRFSQEMTLMGTTHTIGIRHYVPEDPASAIILYGIYKDTNYAASYALVFIFYSFILLYFCYTGGYKEKWKKRLACIFAIFNMVVQIAYFPLANSRGGWVSLCISIFIVLFLFVINRKSVGRNICGKVFLSLLCSVSAVVVCCLLFMAVRTGLSTISVKMELFHTSKQQENLIVENIPNEDRIKPEMQSEQENRTESEIQEEQGNNISNSTDPPVDTPIDPPVIDETKPEEIQIKGDSFVKQNVKVGAGRLEIWGEALELFQYRPVFGEGEGNNVYYAKKYLPESSIALYDKMLHNSYLDLLVDYGIVGTLFMMSFWIGCIITVLRYLFKEKRKISFFSYFCMAIILIGTCSALFLSYLFVNTTAMYFVLLVSTGSLMVECASDVFKT